MLYLLKIYLYVVKNDPIKSAIFQILFNDCKNYESEDYQWYSDLDMRWSSIQLIKSDESILLKQPEIRQENTPTKPTLTFDELDQMLQELLGRDSDAGVSNLE